MKIITTTDELHQYTASLPHGAEVGLVPTMGYLHAGHLQLVKAARRENSHVVVSIFVNPTQFGPHEDLDRYPRDRARDQNLLCAEGVDCVFAPEVEEVYSAGFATYVEVEGALGSYWEAQSRPGHLRGVATVVAKLFNLVRPNRAYFGQKDAQQLAVIRRVEKDLNLRVQVCSVPTVRDDDGLALSSRNTYLSPAEREAATVLYRSFQRAEAIIKDGERNARRIEEAVSGMIALEERARLDYVAMVDAETFERQGLLKQPALLLLAVWVGSTRLIDNWWLEV